MIKNNDLQKSEETCLNEKFYIQVRPSPLRLKPKENEYEQSFAKKGKKKKTNHISVYP